MNRIALLFFLCSIACLGQQLKPRPSFTDFPVKEIFRGVPKAPKLETKDQRMFRTMISNGGEEPEILDFAGHYKIPQWGCGADCSQFAVVDSITGRVYGPFSVSGMPGNWLDDHNNPGIEPHVQFKSSSRLLRLNGCPNERDCGFYDYIIDDRKGLVLIRKELLSAKYQP